MRNIKKILLALIVGIFLTSAIGCSGVKKTDEAVKKSPVAKVNGDKITKDQLKKRMAPTKVSYVANYGSDWEKNEQAKASYKEQEKQTREMMINEVLILQHGKKPTKKEIDTEFKKQYNQLVKNYGSESNLVTTLKQNGYTKDDYKDYLKQQIKVSKTIDNLLKDIKIDDATVKKEYDTNKNTKYTTQPNKMHLQVILSDSEANANAAIARINRGDKFEDVAREVSIDSSTKANGGELGDYYYDESKNPSPLDPDFVKAAMAIPNNKISSSPVKTSAGWYVIKVTNKTNYQVAKFEDVKDVVKNNLLTTKKSQVLQEALKKWKDDLGKKIKLYDKNLE